MGSLWTEIRCWQHSIQGWIEIIHPKLNYFVELISLRVLDVLCNEIYFLLWAPWKQFSHQPIKVPQVHNSNIIITANPIIAATVGRLVFPSRWHSGISSSTTT